MSTGVQGLGQNESNVVLTPDQQIAVSRFVARTYGWMFLGLLLTALVSYEVGAIARKIAATPMIFQYLWWFLGATVAQLCLGITFILLFDRLSYFLATLGYFVFCALTGVTTSIIFLVYTLNSIGHVFLITAGMFGGLAVYGSLTKKDLTQVGALCFLGLWGLILAGLVNIFTQSSALDMGISAVGVIVFTGLTAWDAQKVRQMATKYAVAGTNDTERAKSAIHGALGLYLDFINLFYDLLKLLGELANAAK
jgi:FtsH-binding integral membrane protein